MEQEVTTTLLRPSQPTNPHAIVLEVVARSGFMVSIGTKVVSATKQSVTFEVAKADSLLQFDGFFHGGVIASLADYAGAAATAVAGEVSVPVLTSSRVRERRALL
ncbi:MAG: hypothetical protein OXC60_18195 [Litoreibacter sp.]|nr:hypothetical protein [Litoreibacter sp.]